MRSLLNEAAAETFTLDGRLYRTLKQLVTRPGFLTNEYVAGRRTRYLPPFRLYVGISVVYFVIFLSTGSTRFFFFWVSGDDPQFAGFVRLLPRLMFVLLPAFAAILALLYRNRRRLYTEHLIFSLHFHAFAFLVLPIVAVLNPYLRRVAESGQLGMPGIIFGIVSAATELWVIAYLFVSLRRVYGGSRLVTFFKTIALFVTYMMALAMVGVLLIPHLRTMVWNLIFKG